MALQNNSYERLHYVTLLAINHNAQIITKQVIQSSNVAQSIELTSAVLLETIVCSDIFQHCNLLQRVIYFGATCLRTLSHGLASELNLS